MLGLWEWTSSYSHPVCAVSASRDTLLHQQKCAYKAKRRHSPLELIGKRCLLLSTSRLDRKKYIGNVRIFTQIVELM
ncbi:hypothetical protein DdX_10416 [Ditylenchus destructor]|uniref:Uncharacterized protein n=1 Tax=Ditylenchus destructor TaxID=166010 RepID=A0AAD4R5K6_9BILA|nr:hypothetical protein DdX_10416 [Ditylenchus destructor]